MNETLTWIQARRPQITDEAARPPIKGGSERRRAGPLIRIEDINGLLALPLFITPLLIAGRRTQVPQKHERRPQSESYTVGKSRSFHAPEKNRRRTDRQDRSKSSLFKFAFIAWLKRSNLASSDAISSLEEEGIDWFFMKQRPLFVLAPFITHIGAIMLWSLLTLILNFHFKLVGADDMAIFFMCSFHIKITGSL